MTWNCIKCMKGYAGDKPSDGTCNRCKEQAMKDAVKPLKTKDKVKSEPLELQKFGIHNPVPDVLHYEIRSYDKLHEKKKNLYRKDGILKAKRTF